MGGESESRRVVLEEAVLWSYRLLLGREPESAEIVRFHARAHVSFDSVRRTFMQTEEFAEGVVGTGGWMPKSRTVHYLSDSEVLAHFPQWTGRGEPGFWYDFLGVRTRCSYLPDSYALLSGQVEGPPGTERAAVHDAAEWMGTLRSVLESRANGTFTIVELGAGWGPWLVGAATAAAHVGIQTVHLVGVEGAQSHFNFMLQHFRDNGFEPDVHTLIHGAVGVADGTAHFPIPSDPSGDWGGMADYDGKTGCNAVVGPRDESFEEVRCVALTTLLGQFPRVDLIHCDVQGAEYDVLAAARDAIDARVRRVIVGTHSRRIEGDLLDFFAALGWRLEDEGVCKLVQPGGHGPIGITRDGYQVWANPRY